MEETLYSKIDEKILPVDQLFNNVGSYRLAIVHARQREHLPISICIASPEYREYDDQCRKNVTKQK